jgi:predicted GNAT superfamily acetyltransferase
MEPVAHRPDTPAVTVALPPELEALDPGRRRAWRQAVREALGARLAAGSAVTGFLRQPDRYLVEPSEPAGPP